MWGTEIEIRTLGLLKSDFSLYKTNINYDFSFKEERYIYESPNVFGLMVLKQTVFPSYFLSMAECKRIKQDILLAFF